MKKASNKKVVLLSTESDKPKKTKAIKDEIQKFRDACYARVPGENNYEYINIQLGLSGSSLGRSEEDHLYQIRPALTEMLNKKYL